MGKRKWKNRKRVSSAVFVFTGEMVNLTLKAVALFEQPLQRANHLDERVVFIEETLQSVKRKLELMKESVGRACLTGFDYNEKIIIRQSMLLYALELLEKPPTPEQARELRQSRVIATHFTDDEGLIQ
jgi:hypothetical protein